MNRTGLHRNELDYCAKLLLKNPEHIEFTGFATHFAGAESVANYLRIKKQFRLYEKALKRLESKGLKPMLRHTACSAASLSYPKTRMDMIRLGIVQYGFWPSMETRIRWMTKNNMHESPLQRMISWKSRIMSIKQVKTGEFVGYGTTFLAQKDTLIAAVPVGYSHGYSRSLSNQGRVLVCGKRTAVIGTVNMNAMVIDITDIPEASIGEEVILIGEVDDVEVSVASFSELSNQLNYELLTRLPNDIPRRILSQKED
jgi:alanine racemase